MLINFNKNGSFYNFKCFDEINREEIFYYFNKISK